ncbi:unnamed protein product, partial [Prorocentrum cordatum]
MAGTMLLGRPGFRHVLVPKVGLEDPRLKLEAFSPTMGFELTSLDLWWTSWMAILPFFTMFLCSEPMRFIL